jgi:hypothetical protein
MLLPKLSAGVMRARSEVAPFRGAIPSQPVTCQLDYECNGVPYTINTVSNTLDNCCAMAAAMAHNSCMSPMNTCQLVSCGGSYG